MFQQSFEVHIVDEGADELSDSTSSFAHKIFKIYLLNQMNCWMIGPKLIARARRPQLGEKASRCLAQCLIFRNAIFSSRACYVVLKLVTVIFLCECLFVCSEIFSIVCEPILM